MEEKQILSDKDIIPDDDLIFSLIGEKKYLWQNIMSYISVTYSDSAGGWRFYNDGKRWLFKMVNKKKTLFWISILENTFRVTFWFGDKAGPLIEESELPENIKDDFRKAKKYGSVRGVSIIMNDNRDTDNVIKLTEIKNKIN